jgi:hypothetical protein
MKFFDDRAREAGGDAGMARRLDELDRNGDPSLRIDAPMRASKDGKVNANTTYEDWFRGQPRSVQEDIMGTKRLQMFEEGRLNFQTAVDPAGRPLTIGELREKYECYVDPKRFKAWHGPMEEEFERLRPQYSDIGEIAKRMPQKGFAIPKLPQNIRELLGTDADSLIFSAETLVKQFANHPDLTAEMYANALSKIKDCQEIYDRGRSHIGLIIEGQRKYMLILKPTIDHKEAYVASFYSLDERSLQKKRKGKRII